MQWIRPYSEHYGEYKEKADEFESFIAADRRQRKRHREALKRIMEVREGGREGGGAICMYVHAYG